MKYRVTITERNPAPGHNWGEENVPLVQKKRTYITEEYPEFWKVMHAFEHCIIDKFTISIKSFD